MAVVVGWLTGVLAIAAALAAPSLAMQLLSMGAVIGSGMAGAALAALRRAHR